MANLFQSLGNLKEKAGDLNQMRKQAMMMQQIQQMLGREEVDFKSGNIRIIITGNQKIKLVEVDGIKNDALMRAFNDAITKSQDLMKSKAGEITKALGMG